MIEQALLDSIPFGLLVTDRGLRVTAVNRWIVEQCDVRLPTERMGALTDLFPEIKDRGLQSLYELVLESEQRVTISNRIHKYLLKMPGRPEVGLNYMPQAAVVAPLFEGANLSGTITIVSDVSERVIVEGILNREIDKLSILHEIDVALATLDLQACLTKIVTQTHTHFSAEGIAVFLADGEQLSLAAGVGMPGPGWPAPAASLAVWCFRERQPRFLNHTQNGAGLVPLASHAEMELAAPLLIGNDCIGVIQACLGPARESDRHDLDLLQALAARAATAIQNAQLHTASEYWRQYHERVNARLQTLLNATRLMNAQLDVQENLDSVTKMLQDVFRVESVIILKLEPRSDQLRPAAAVGASDRVQAASRMDRAAARLAAAADSQLNSRLDLSPGPHWPETYRQALLSAGLCCVMSVALAVRDTFIGLAQVFSADPRRDFNAEEQELFKAMAAQLSLALQNAELFAQQTRLAVTDGLTGVFNRRRFDQELEVWLKRSARSDFSVALIMLDIDNFKRLNDTFGHLVGDEVLKRLAQVIQENVRAIDIVARYGGEEFVIILPTTELGEAVLVAERLRQAAQALPRQAGSPLAQPEMLTISLGVAAAPLHAAEPQGLIRAADAFLYQAKREGKNRVVPPSA